MPCVLATIHSLSNRNNSSCPKRAIHSYSYVIFTVSNEVETISILILLIRQQRHTQGHMQARSYNCGFQGTVGKTELSSVTHVPSAPSRTENK